MIPRDPTRVARCAVVAMALASWCADAQAQTRRYALVIGNNHGEPEDAKLKYADRDARRVARVLRQMGNVPAAHMHMLVNAGASQAEAALRKLNARIRADRKAHPGAEALLLVYYSGHADRRALHMSGTTLPFRRVRALMERSPAELRVLIVDACRSGELTRVKGARPAKPFKIDALQENSSRGLAIITSATAGENAQESDRIRGSYFTHHFLAGLLGAADTSRDHAITLSEAYKYAYDETLRSTSRLPYLQHPTYAFKIRGRSDVVLTRLNARHQTYGQLAIKRAGRYVIFRGSPQGDLVTEFSTRQPTRLLLKAGEYFVRWRVKERIHEARVTVPAKGEVVRVDARKFRRVPYAQIVRKGRVEHIEGASTTSLSLRMGAAYSGAILPETSPLRMARVGAQLDMPSWSLALSGRLGTTTYTNDFLTTRQRALGAELGAFKVYDWRRAHVGMGLGAGLDWVHQEFLTSGSAPPRDGINWFAGPRLTAGVVTHPRVTLTTEGALDLNTSRQLDTERGGVIRRYTPSLRLGVGLSIALF